MGCHHNEKRLAAGGDGLPIRLSDPGICDADRLMLQLARHLFRDVAFPGHGDRQMAISVAQAGFGYGCGAAMVADLRHAILLLADTRRDVFHYHNPDCPGCSDRLSAAELMFLRLLQALRERQASAAAVNAMLLCEGNSYQAFLDVLARLYLPGRIGHDRT
ncbi:hypothetical protein HOY34_19625 [Xinfangfangia sp. D13-10-4-6]|uniref:hypothetical protein n=1 Tax=Pseudogemmobacter hezensis TaxID=2737662 RepID=UPI00155562C0|nr:hypothetical protein [Pseudogemmobacter hezensis]NPD17399.1 hypothetical protein [Pseudogemmobacter hezensis]